MKKELVELRVNGRSHEIAFEPSKLLLDVLRQDLELTGSKRGCDDSSCGACTVLVDGIPMMSCTLVSRQLRGSGDYDGRGRERTRQPGRHSKSLWRLGRSTVRLLHSRIHYDGQASAGRKSRTDRTRNSQRPERKSLPLYRIQPDVSSHKGRD